MGFMHSGVGEIYIVGRDQRQIEFIGQIDHRRFAGGLVR